MLIFIGMFVVLSSLFHTLCLAAIFNEVLKTKQLLTDTNTVLSIIQIHTSKAVSGTAALASYICTLLDSLKLVINNGQYEALKKLPSNSIQN